MTTKLIIDGDFGGDEMQLLAVMLAHKHLFQVLGLTTTFGNAPLNNVLDNAGAILKLFDREDIPLLAGAAGPTGGPEMKSADEGDGAHGENGMGGASLPFSDVPPRDMAAKDYILQVLRHNPENTVSITATGPLTNIAQAFREDPNTMARVKEIVIMGGCTQSMPAADIPTRQGNITPYAEFNTFMAPQDAKTVFESGLPITVLPMNCTHQMTFDDNKERMLRMALATREDVVNTIIAMIKAPEALDRMKFNQAPVMHDVQTALYLLYPEHYKTESMAIDVTLEGEKQGMTTPIRKPYGTVNVAHTIINPDNLALKVISAFQAVLSPQGHSIAVPTPKI